MIHQVSKFYRQGVIRPLDQNAKNDVENFGVSASIRCEWLPILDDNQFDTIWKSGLLEAIGRKCNTRFTDYEEILLETNHVCLAVLAVREFLSDATTNELRMFAESLLGLLVDAQASGMPVLFVL